MVERTIVLLTSRRRFVDFGRRKVWLARRVDDFKRFRVNSRVNPRFFSWV